MVNSNLSDCFDAVQLISTDMTTLDCYALSTKRGVFVDGDGKMSLPSMKMAVFVDEVRDICYICMMS